MTHVNAISYNPKLDQIVISSAGFSEIWIIDHSTTTEEAKGDIGGRWGHGGDLLYRWGNPANYGRGGPENQTLLDSTILSGFKRAYPGAGNLMVYNNDIMSPDSKFQNGFAAMGALETINISIGDLSNYSAVFEFVPPVDENGTYILEQGGTFGPEGPTWAYTAPDKLSSIFTVRFWGSSYEEWKYLYNYRRTWTVSGSNTRQEVTVGLLESLQPTIP